MCLAGVKVGMTGKRGKRLDSERDAPVRPNASTRPVAILLREGWRTGANPVRDAKATETRSAETEGFGPKDDGAAPKGFAQKEAP